MNDLQETIDEIVNLDEARYFYHLTSKSGEDILEEGLFVANPLWEQSFLEFTEEEIKDIDSVIDNNRSKIRNSHTMIIAGIYKDAIDDLIRPLNKGEKAFVDFDGVGSPDYIVVSRFIVGYVDMDTREIVLNDRAMVSDFFEL